jgi:hypothetical protein
MEWRPKVANAGPTQGSQTGGPVKMDSGTFVVPVEINGTMSLPLRINSSSWACSSAHYALLDTNLFPDHESPPSLPCGDRGSEVAVIFNDGSD